MVDHSASGPEHTTTPHTAGGYAHSDSLSLRLPPGLTSRHVPDSQAHSSRHAITPPRSQALTDCRTHTVSGTISLPPGTFHHSSRYFSAIGHGKYSGLPDGPGRFTADFTGLALLGNSSSEAMEFSVTGLSPSTAGHPRPLHLTPWFITPAPAGRQKNVPQHRTHNPCRVSHVATV